MTSSLVVNDKQFRDDLPDQIFFFSNMQELLIISFITEESTRERE